MPTENEFKYILDINSHTDISNISKNVVLISQGYIAEGVRIRCIDTNVGRTNFEVGKYFLTVKRTVNNRCIEIENQIDWRDFEDLWTIATNKLSKYRYDVEGWDVDFFYHNYDCYFALAEKEVPEGCGPPKYMPPVIQQHLIVIPNIKQEHLTSYKLSNVEYAKNILNSYWKKS